MNRPLGRRVPTDDDHIRAYPLRLAPLPESPVPVCLGVNWYEDFDTPVSIDRRWWIGVRSDRLGRIRGGHCVCIKPSSLTDLGTWYTLMDQGVEGSCVGFGATRMMMLLNRRRYQARWLYDQAQVIDEWADTPPEEGTSVRAAMDVLRTVGHRRVHGRYVSTPDLADGIRENRWATSVDQIRDCLHSPRYDRIGAVPILNSWGRSYPHLTWLPFDTLDRLLRENGEATMVTDA